MLGGAIKTDVHKMNVETPELPGIDKVLRQTQLLTASPIMYEYIHGLTDYIPRNQIGFYQYPRSYVGENEVDLHRNLKTLVTGKGASQDHHMVATAVHESLKHIPKLASLYLNS